MFLKIASRVGARLVVTVDACFPPTIRVSWRRLDDNQRKGTGDRRGRNEGRGHDYFASACQRRAVLGEDLPPEAPLTPQVLPPCVCSTPTGPLWTECKAKGDVEVSRAGGPFPSSAVRERIKPTEGPQARTRGGGSGAQQRCRQRRERREKATKAPRGKETKEPREEVLRTQG